MSDDPEESTAVGGQHERAPDASIRRYPSPASVADYLRSLFDEWAEQRQSADDSSETPDEKRQLDDESARLKAVHDAYLEVAKGSLDRAIDRGTYVTTAASAVGTTYTALLALVYAADTSKGGRALTGAALIPAVFIGCSIVLATVYMSFLKYKSRERELLPTGIGGRISQVRLVTFFEWTLAGVLTRAWALRGAVVLLGLGVLLLPVPFVSVTGLAVGPLTGTAVLVTAAVVVVVVWAAAELVWLVRRPSASPGPAVADPAKLEGG